MILVAAITALGLLGNVAYTLAQKPVYTSNTLVVLAPSVNANTQAVVVRSIPVLDGALRDANLGLSLQALENQVEAAPAAARTLSISAHRTTAAAAEQTANAVTASYVSYITSSQNPLGEQAAQLLQDANTATVKPLTTRVYQAAGLGALIAALVALISVLAVWRNDARLRERDAIADSAGIPVLASLRANCPADVAGWTRLLDKYEPAAADAAALHNVLRAIRARGSSISVLSLSTDPGALALGPQLAAFAASQGIPTALVVDPSQGTRPDSKSAAALRAACGAAAAAGVQNPRLIARDHNDPDQLPTGMFAICVAVADAQTPRVGQTTHSALTVLSVTAGAVTAEQMTRVAASSAAAAREIVGILVANPVRADQTTGRMPQLARPDQYRMPTRMVGVATESRR
jgi:capsular polysaccharide biosynthesis protein